MTRVAAVTGGAGGIGEAVVLLGRAAEPREIADAVAFLAAEASGYMTGQTLHVNGGRFVP